MLDDYSHPTLSDPNIDRDTIKGLTLALHNRIAETGFLTGAEREAMGGLMDYLDLGEPLFDAYDMSLAPVV